MAGKAAGIAMAGALLLCAVLASSRAQSPPASPAVANRPPTFYADVLPILQDHCQQCHRLGEIAPMPLLTYAQAKKFAPKIAHMTASKMMPPWFADPRFGHFANDVSLTDAQIAL